MSLHDLYIFADQQDIEIQYIPCGETAIALPTGKIGIDPDHENAVVLAHEIGHIMTYGFYSFSTDEETIRKHEAEATRFAIELLIPREEFYDFVRGEYITPWVLADYFGISEEFAEKVIKYYKSLL